MAEELIPLETDPQVEIARLKDLLLFARRDASSSIRVEVRFPKEGDTGAIVCITCPSMDERAIAKIVVNHLGAIWREGTREKIQTRLCLIIQPLVDVIQTCKHLDDSEDGVCIRCIHGVLKAIGAIVNDGHEFIEDDGPEPTEKQQSKESA